MAILIDDKKQRQDALHPFPLVDVYDVKEKAKLPGTKERALEAVKVLARDEMVKPLYQTAGVYVQVTEQGREQKPRYVGLGP
jgi:hypothetical protein